jgi:hypothetical protein
MKSGTYENHAADRPRQTPCFTGSLNMSCAEFSESTGRSRSTEACGMFFIGVAVLAWNVRRIWGHLNFARSSKEREQVDWRRTSDSVTIWQPSTERKLALLICISRSEHHGRQQQEHSFMTAATAVLSVNFSTKECSDCLTNLIA